MMEQYLDVNQNKDFFFSSLLVYYRPLCFRRVTGMQILDCKDSQYVYSYGS